MTVPMVEARGVLYLGLHGLEETTSDGRTSTRYDDALRAKVGSLVEAIRESPEPDRWDLTIETKGPIVAVHYRESQVKLRARDVEEMRRCAQDLADLHGFDLMPGRKVFEFKPRLEIDKGTAVMRAAQRAGSSMVLYLGDDRSDIDAFRAIHNSTVTEGVAGAVLSEEMPAGLTDEADLSVNEVSEAVELLRVLVQRLEH